MAPVQATPFRDVKPTADQYSAAATLYALLCGVPQIDMPKDGGRQIAAFVNSRPVPIRVHPPELPSALAEVIHRALAREPDDRFPDTLAFRDALLPFAP